MSVYNLPGHKSVLDVLEEVKGLMAKKGIKAILVQGLYEDNMSFSVNSSINISEKCFIKCMMDAEINRFFNCSEDHY